MLSRLKKNIENKKKENKKEDEDEKEKLTKKEKNEMKCNNKKMKSQYKFEVKDNLKSVNLTKTNNINNLTTLYSENVEVIIGGKTLISESNIVINAGYKYFVLGKNGIGKTTLLKQIYLELVNKIDILMIEQDIILESPNQKICDFILGADEILYSSKKRMNELEKMEEMNSMELEEYEMHSKICYEKEWDKYEADSKRIINGLGFNDPNLFVNILSGGKRMILAIGKALLRKPEILILDEPTNHLDLDVVIWITQYLSEYKKTLIIITHQIGLVNSLSDVIWYIGKPDLIENKVYAINGNYDKLLKFLKEKEVETNKNYEKFEKKKEELIKKSTPKKTVEEFTKKENVPRPPKPYIVNITFDNVINLSTQNIIEFKEVGFGYNENEKIYENLNISLSMGSKIILVGANGCGKTTFFKLASEKIKPSNGYIFKDERLRVGY